MEETNMSTIAGAAAAGLLGARQVINRNPKVSMQKRAVFLAGWLGLISLLCIVIPFATSYFSKRLAYDIDLEKFRQMLQALLAGNISRNGTSGFLLPLTLPLPVNGD